MIVNKTSLKLIGLFALLVILAFLTLYFLNYYNNNEREIERYFADLKKRYIQENK
ncbi:MAG: hypothetical protein AAB474_01915 [Patescibacteria group bacterium]